MADKLEGLPCQTKCWLWAGLAGLVLMVILLLMGATFLGALFGGILVAVLGSILLQWWMCRADASAGDSTTAASAPATPAAPATTAAASPAAAATAPEPAAAPEPPKPEAPPAAPPAQSAPAETAKAVAEVVPGDEDKPATLGAPREGGADDLKKIKGVGPKLEALLHRLGFFHFDQIANWTDREVAWVDQNLEGFKGRVVRDNWVEQAKDLAAGRSS